MAFNRQSSLVAGCIGALTFLSGICAHADDTEIFTGGTSANSVRPNIMFVLDTSGSMGSNVTTQVEYDPAQSYSGTGNCSGINSRVYYSTTGTPPACGSNNWFDASKLKCRDARDNGLASSGSGRYIGTFVRWGTQNNNGTNRSWRASFSPSNAGDIDCRADNGIDGNLTTSNPYPTNGTSTDTNGVWVGDSTKSIWVTSSGVAGTLFSGNYIAYWNQFRTTSIGTRMSIMQTAAIDLLGALSDVNVGLMRYSRNGGSGDLVARGGMVAYPVSPIETNRTALINAVKSYTADGYTPLSETLYEAEQYFAQRDVTFGNISVPFKSVAGSRVDGVMTSNTYDSPADYSCQKNHLVYLTDGLPTADSEANSLITALPDFATHGGTCDTSGPSTDWPNAGWCLSALAGYMNNADLRSDIAGKQNVVSHWIGFGDDVAGGTPFQYLQRAAAAGGGRAFTAQDSGELTTVMTDIVTSILQTSTTFSAPTVAVNAFDRTRSLNDLYVSVFRPSLDRHWAGNVKKYKVVRRNDQSIIVDQHGNLAVDEQTGFFADSAKSFWSSAVDGPIVREGGAANQIPLPAARKVYTYVGANPGVGSSVALTAAANAVDVGNTTVITDAVLGIGSAGDPSRTDLINWIRGQDVLDEYPWSTGPDGNLTERRRAMGDPIHAQPAVVIYGSNGNIDDAVAFAPTNDGFLHAIDVATGAELWSYIPEKFLPEMKRLYLNEPAASKNYMLDGQVRVLKFDLNRDGRVDAAAGDKVLIFFSEGRGGSDYYALDVTDKTQPRFMWRMGSSTLPGIGQAWSPPTIARVNISGATQNSQKLVLIIGGGYDTQEDNGPYVASAGAGNAIYMIDALRGTVLWRAGLSGADFNHSRMTHSIPSAITVMDTQPDGYADRMYVGDMGGQVWRFDIVNFDDPTTTTVVENDRANLVRGGVLASVGSHDETTHTVANTRRFYNGPDVAPMQSNTAEPFFNIALGSGYRGHPLVTANHDRIYSIRDHRPFQMLTQQQYNDWTPITETNLKDVSSDLSATIAWGDAGWFMSLNQPAGSWIGEKSLGQITTIDGSLIFTTYTPSTNANADPCTPAYGSNRAYRVSAMNGSPAKRPDQETSEPEDRYEDFNFGGIASDVSTMFLDDDARACAASDPSCNDDNEGGPRRGRLVCLAGAKVLNICKDFDSRIKTYWRDKNAP